MQCCWSYGSYTFLWYKRTRSFFTYSYMFLYVWIVESQDNPEGTFFMCNYWMYKGGMWERKRSKQHSSIITSSHIFNLFTKRKREENSKRNGGMGMILLVWLEKTWQTIPGILVDTIWVSLITKRKKLCNKKKKNLPIFDRLYMIMASRLKHFRNHLCANKILSNYNGQCMCICTPAVSRLLTSWVVSLNY